MLFPVVMVEHRREVSECFRGFSALRSASVLGCIKLAFGAVCRAWETLRVVQNYDI